MSRQTQAYLYAGCAVLLWSTVASAFKVSLRYVEAPHMLLYATIVSTAVLLAVAAWQGKLGEALACSPKQYLGSAALGLLNPFLYYLVLFEAYDRLPAQEAQPLNYAWPMMVVILSVPLLKQPLGRISLAAIVVSFCGVLVIGTRGDLLAFRFSDPIGTALAVGSAFIWATFWLTNLRDDRDAVVKLLLNFSFGLAFVAVAAVALAGPPPLDLRSIGGSAYAGVFEMGLTFVLWMRALSLSRTTAQVSNLVYLSPFLSLVFISVIVGETIRPSSVVGLLLIVGGIVIRRFERTPSRPA